LYEGSAWEYSLYAPHDMAALIKLSGGPAAFKNRLDTLFEKRYYNVSNEPSFLSPCLYHWIGRPDLSSKRLRDIISASYNSSAAGLPGNDDSGAMSSWLDFHFMGLYPNAGQSYYLVTTPFFKQVTIHQENGKAPGQSVFYSWTDTDPLAGNNLYRLKITQNTTVIYSDVINFVSNQEGLIRKITPSGNNSLRIEVNVFQNEKVTIYYFGLPGA